MRVDELRTWQAPDKTRLVFDVSGPVEHSVFTLSAPDRVVIDLRDATLRGKFAQPAADQPVLARIRTAARRNGDLRVVLDLKSPVRPKSFLLKPSHGHGNRLVLDLLPAAVSSGPSQSDEVAAATPLPRTKLRDVVIAIDAGHGGVDPGARGAHGTREKDVALAIARKLQRLVQKERGMRAVMVRDGDYYLRLRKRINIARKNKADLFVSIHADAFRDASVQGSSVYALSQHGASSEAARWLAENENSADLIGGVSLDDKDDLLASVLLDLSQTATIEASLGVGDRVLGYLKQVGQVHKSRVQQAGFVVLKSPDIPSILVETGYISNPREESRLRDPAHQDQLAEAILKGIHDYFVEYAPPGTVLAARRHVITPGDTLSDLARRYHVSQETLRVANQLPDDQLQVGEVLRIPWGQGS